LSFHGHVSYVSLKATGDDLPEMEREEPKPRFVGHLSLRSPFTAHVEKIFGTFFPSIKNMQIQEEKLEKPVNLFVA